MKKIASIIIIVFIAFTLSGCATVFGGSISEHQKTKPKPGEPQRDIRVAALIFDVILFWPGTIVDFATGAIYKPEPGIKKAKKAKKAKNK